MKYLALFLTLVLSTTVQAQTVTIAHGGTSATTAAQARINLGLPSILVQATDDTTSSLTAHSSPLTFSAAKNSTYTFDMYGYFTSSSNAGIKAAVAVPSGATLVATAIETGTTASDTHTEAFTASGTLGAAFTQGTSLNGVFHIHGVVTTASTANSVTLQFAKVTSGTATLKAGSYIKWTKVS